jgi:competence protein ComEA
VKGALVRLRRALVGRGHVLLAVLALALCLSATDAEARAPKGTKRFSGIVNLNLATAADLDRLPGVGPKAAQQIIAYRQKHPFQRVEELVKVKGFGRKRFEKLKPYLRVVGPTTLTLVETGKRAQGT